MYNKYAEKRSVSEGFDVATYRDSLVVGKKYTVTLIGKRDDDNFNRKVKATLVKKCGSFALFNMGGWKESFLYYDLRKMGC